jgi:hypothetical protein
MMLATTRSPVTPARTPVNIATFRVHLIKSLTIVASIPVGVPSIAPFLPPSQIIRGMALLGSVMPFGNSRDHVASKYTCRAGQWRLLAAPISCLHPPEMRRAILHKTRSATLACRHRRVPRRRHISPIRQGRVLPPSRLSISRVEWPLWVESGREI